MRCEARGSNTCWRERRSPLALALTPYASSAFAASETEITAAVPMPESADLPPPSIKDIAPADAAAMKPAASADTAAPKPAAAEVTSSVPAADGAKFATASVGDTAIVEKLRDQLAAGKFDRILGGKKERSTVEAFYSGRDFAPLWIADGAMSERAKAAAAYLAGVDADGLDPSEYPVPQIKSGMEPEALAEAEIKFTDAVLTFARHAMSGRVHYTPRLRPTSSTTSPSPIRPTCWPGSPRRQDVAAALDSLNPPQPQYKALKAKLAEARDGAADAAKPVIPPGPVLKYSKDKKGQEVLMEDPRVPALRERFGLKATDGDTNYDKTLADTIAKFQKEQRPQRQRPAHAGDARRHQRAEAREDRSISSSPTWNAGAGCRATSARPT